MRKRVEKSSTILALLDGYSRAASRPVSLSNYCIAFDFFSGFMFMKSSIVYAVALRKLIL